FLPDAIQLKENRVFYQPNVGIVLLRQSRFYKNVEAIFSCNFYVGELISPNAIHIDTETGFAGIGKNNGRYQQCLLMWIVNFQLAGGSGNTGEYGVHTQRVL